MDVIPPEILDQICNSISLKQCCQLNMTCKSINEKISMSDRFLFFKSMCRGQCTVSLSSFKKEQTQQEQEQEETKSDQKLIETPLIKFRVDRSFINYTEIYSIDSKGTLTFNMVKLKTDQERNFERFINKLESIEQQVENWNEELDDSFIRLRIIFDAGFYLSVDLPLDDYTFESSYGKITFYDQVSIKFCVTEFNRSFGDRSKSWIKEWVRHFVSSRKGKEFWQPQDFIIKLKLDKKYLLERHRSNEHYKCHNCKNFRSK